jgi:hypothetical protein
MRKNQADLSPVTAIAGFSKPAILVPDLLD